VLYRLVRWIARLTLNSYFRKIVITGKENISSHGPVVLVANHPSAFMDPMVVACTVRRPLNFLVAAEFFNGKWKSWVYQNYLNMIPVYRPTTLPGEAYKNDTVFSKVIDLLSTGGSILVFPEGNSVTEKRIRKIKTGVARMALGTKEASGVEVKIITHIDSRVTCL
jgi:1-acyl-sn-glycerol-3-phosphate acyltransferase